MSAPSRLLVVDDNETNRYTLVRLLTHAGYQVAEAATGEGALKHRRLVGLVLFVLVAGDGECEVRIRLCRHADEVEVVGAAPRADKADDGLVPQAESLTEGCESVALRPLPRGRETGGLSHLLPGYRKVTDPADRAAMAGRLDDAFRVLTSGSRTAAARLPSATTV